MFTSDLIVGVLACYVLGAALIGALCRKVHTSVIVAGLYALAFLLVPGEPDMSVRATVWFLCIAVVAALIGHGVARQVARLATKYLDEPFAGRPRR